MQEDKQTLKEKQFLQWVKRRDELQEIKRKLPWRKLEIPEQDGWILNIRLTSEAFRRADGERMLTAILACDQDHLLSKTKSAKISKLRKNTQFTKARPFFIRKNWDGSNIYDGPSLRSLKPKEFDAIPDNVKKFFYKKVVEHVSRWGGATYETITYPCNIPEYLLAIRVRKRMLTHIQDIDPKVVSELKWIEEKLEEYYRTSSRGRAWDDADRDPKRDRRHSKDAINHYKNGDLSDPMYYSKLSKQRH